LLTAFRKSGRLAAHLLELGFNQDEGASSGVRRHAPHIGSVRNYINVRSPSPVVGRNAAQDKQYPGPEGPLTYGDSLDSFTGKAKRLTGIGALLRRPARESFIR